MGRDWYRLGRFSETILLGQKALEHPSPPVHAEAYLLMAMAQKKLGNDSEAGRALTNAVNTIKGHFSGWDTEMDLGIEWEDWAILHALLKEAKELLEPQSIPISAHAQ